MRSQHVALLGEQSPPRVRFAPQVRANSWEDVSDLVAAYGLTLDGWQEEVLQAGLGERSDGTWAARQVGLSTPRQNGKTQVIVARVLAGLLIFGEETILVSAHRQDTAREVFFRLVQVIEDNPLLNERVDFIARSEMREYIRMKSGQEVRFKARSESSGRGFSCDCLMLDEAQDLNDEAWAAILPTMSARPNPQVWLLGTPPTTTTNGEVFARIRQAGIERKAGRLAYMEWAADESDDFDDPATWAKANPALGIRVTAEAIESERAAMSDEQFARERLGIWNLAVGNRQSVIPMDAWRDRADPDSKVDGPPTLGVEVGPDLAWASVSLAGRRPDGEWHVELVENRNGAAWLPGYLRELMDLNPGIQGVVADVGGPIKAMVTQRGQRYILDGPEIQVTPMRVAELAAACTRMLDGTVTGWLRHIDQPQLTAAAQAAGKRMIGDTGTWVFSRKSTTSDITPIQSATYALWGAQNQPKVKRPSTARGRAGGRVYVTRERAGRSAG